MKRTHPFGTAVLVACFLALCLIIVGCAKKNGSAGSLDGMAGGNAQEAIKDVKKSSVVLLHGASLWEETPEGMKYSGTANVADVYECDGKVKKAVRLTDKQEREFHNVKMAGESKWIQSVFLATEAVPGVITGMETIRYTKPDPVATTGLLISQYEIVAVHPGSEKDGFLAISAYIPAREKGGKDTILAREFIKAEHVTIEDRDVKALRLYAIAMASDNPAVKKDLLNSAQSIDSSFRTMISLAYSEFIGVLDDVALEPIEVYGDERPALELISLSQDMYVNDDNVNVRDYPDATNGTVRARLQRDVIVLALDRTADPATVGGVTDYWYHIQEPDGWVFGQYLSAGVAE